MFRSRHNPFLNWPEPQGIEVLPDRSVNDCDSLENTGQEGTISFLPIMNILLGKTGRQILDDLLLKIGPAPTSATRPYFAWVGEQNLLFEKWDVSTIKLKAEYATYRRQSFVSSFRQSVQQRELLIKKILQAGRQVKEGGTLRLMIVGNPYEAETGLISDLLLLTDIASRQLPHIAGVESILMTVVYRSGNEVLSDNEVITGLRELHGLTHPSPHLVEKFPEQDLTNPYSSNMQLSQWIWVEAPGNVRMPAMELVERSAETMLALLQPGELLFDQPDHRTNITALGISSRWMPIYPLREYVATRLATAVLLGEGHPTDRPLFKQNLRINRASSANDYSSFLREAGHPFFQWLATDNSSDGVPPLDKNRYCMMFVSELAHWLSALLQKGATLSDLQTMLEGLTKHLNEAKRWRFRNADSTDLREYQNTLQKMLATIDDLLRQISFWERSVSAIQDKLNAQLLEYADLMQCDQFGNVSKPLICDDEGANSYYNQYVRPEFNPNRGKTNELATAVNKVRKCVAWRFEYRDLDFIDLKLICARSESFKVTSSMDELVSSVMNLTRAQVGNIEQNLTGPYFRTVLEAQIDDIEQEAQLILANFDNLKPHAPAESIFISREQINVDSFGMRFNIGGSVGRATLLIRQTLPIEYLHIWSRLQSQYRDSAAHVNQLYRNARAIELQYLKGEILPDSMVKWCWDNHLFLLFFRCVVYDLIKFENGIDVGHEAGSWVVSVDNRNYKLGTGSDQFQALREACDLFTYRFPYLSKYGDGRMNPYMETNFIETLKHNCDIAEQDRGGELRAERLEWLKDWPDKQTDKELHAMRRIFHHICNK